VNTTPSTRQRLVGAALRQARQAMGYTLDTPAAILSCDRSKICRIESGERGIRAEELRALLSEYGISDPLAATLVRLAHPHRQKGWWQDFPSIVTGISRDYAVIEAAANDISIYRESHVPALLQTPDYARGALAKHPDTAPENPSQAVEALLARQKAILGDSGRRIEAVIAEGALHQQVGGDTVMNAQAKHLAELPGRHPNLAIQVLPFSAGAHAGLWTGPMTIVRFPPSALGAVCRPGINDRTYLEDPDSLGLHVSAFTRLRHQALTPKDSAQRIRAMM
jgi:transcriptional regulator with XRE-family HTH domain